MSATKLQIYNEALTEHLGERELASLTESREPRRVLDNIWDAGGVNYCLEKAQWSFGRRVLEITADTSVSPDFGHQFAFARPTDLARITKLCTDEFLRCPLLDYTYEGGYFFADIDIIYLEYVSTDTGFGGDMSRWPESFTRVVAAYLAYRACGRIKSTGASKDDLRKEFERLLADAASKDAMSTPTRFPPAGSWVSSRGGNGNGERGSRTTLMG